VMSLNQTQNSQIWHAFPGRFSGDPLIPSDYRELPRPSVYMWISGIRPQYDAWN
ncbi:hypothetical protein EWB00_000698, partial [Schistosoma japonicum]